MSTNTANNYFELFGLTPAFNIDAATLEMRFRKIQSESHPDRFVTAPAAEKLKSMTSSKVHKYVISQSIFTFEYNTFHIHA